ncbi:N-acetylmuramoyl-L-alanine amidase family protein [Sporosalibacterium faouarense]|uniref:N-acetylmuramoyl-L-alanine amidase family protein n=1 Tax=Sporosalibacterium faouarense TaxID=516123 RepID=UPI00192ADAE8|nr:N-acetylmuramoyl-L-alanine amidase family protein [Sporosalibacterium faouarense]
MKKIAILFVVAFLVFNVVLNAPALIFADKAGYVKVHMDGKEVSLMKVNVEINGQALESDVPPLVYDERTLVPIRFVAENLNAEVNWHQEEQEAVINALGKEIILKPNSSQVIIDGEKKELPYGVPAKIVNDGRTMVPLRFVSEELGCSVKWDQETLTASIQAESQEVLDIDVDMNTDYPRVVVKTSGPVLYNTIELGDFNKLVIDIPNSTLNIEDESKVDTKGILNLEVEKYPIKAVRSSQFKVDPNVTRIAIDLDNLTDYEINYLSNGEGFEIKFINNVSDVVAEEIDGNKAIIIKNSNKVEYSSFVLQDPNRIVIDLMSSNYDVDKYEYEIDDELISGIRVAQFDHDGYYNENEKVVRVVLDIKENAYMPEPQIETIDNNLVIFLEDKDFSSIDYNTLESDKGSLEITGLKETDYDVVYDDEVNTMHVRMPKDNIEIDNGKLNIDDDLVEDITIKEDGEEKVFEIKLKKNIEYTSFEKNGKKNILIVMEYKNKKYGDKLIIIDAGHGGKDPGTTAINSKIHEKELTLMVAKRLEKKLNEIGFKTYLTRDNDEYIGLYERTDKANSMDGDAFISIHFNAHNNPDVKGIETIYCPSYGSDQKTEDQYPFAETIHSAVVDAIGGIDRGINRRPEIVVTRESKMVAALVELGFISNPEEEKAILSFDYIDKAVDGISEGLMEYFDK